MTQTTKTVVTNTGRDKIAAAIAAGGANDVNVTHMALGDGQTVHSGGETELYNEIFRKAISASGVVDGAPNTVFFDMQLLASEGPFTIREAGLFDDDGDLIAVAHYDPPIEKTLPTSGQSQSGIVKFKVAVENSGVITFDVDSDAYVPNSRKIETVNGLSGGGDLGQDRIFQTNWDTLSILSRELQLTDTLNFRHSTSGGGEYQAKGELSDLLEFLGDTLTVLPSGGIATSSNLYTGLNIFTNWDGLSIVHPEGLRGTDLINFRHTYSGGTYQAKGTVDDLGDYYKDYLTDKFVSLDAQIFVDMIVGNRSITTSVSLVSGVHTIVPLTGITNDNGEFTITNGKMVCVQPGEYYILSRCQVGLSNSAKVIQAGRVTHNGNAVISGQAITMDADSIVGLIGAGGVSVTLEVGDELAVTAYQFNTSSAGRSTTALTAAIYASKLRDNV